MIHPIGYYRNHKHEFHLGFIAFVAVAVAWSIWTMAIPNFGLDRPTQVEIKSGQGLASIAQTLLDNGVIRSKLAFELYISVQGLEANLKAGTYIFKPDEPMYQVASEVAGGRAKSDDIVVFIPEGYNVWEIDKRLTEVGLIKEGDFARAYQSDEGKMFPDTYRFSPHSLLGQIEQTMEDNGKTKTDSLLGNLTPLGKERILTIASLIEKEARNINDMHLVSGVIQNRLKRGMPLGIDAAVDYGACVRQFFYDSSKDCVVQQVAVGKEISIDSPYNTYTRVGLPERPIANPGLNAIEAALNPTGDYLYYLSTRDGSQIIFEKTAAQHEADRKKYLGL